ncbi:MAG TPA: hypothetical protein VGM76_06250 [Lacipirellulaceae bacterium]
MLSYDLAQVIDRNRVNAGSQVRDGISGAAACGELEVISLAGRMFPIVLSFGGGGTMRLMGIHLRDRQAMVALLQEQVPECRVEM